MSGCKRRGQALVLALSLLFTASWALALDCQPKAGAEVAPGDSITYTYTLPAKREICALRLSLGPGLTLRENSVKVTTSHEPEVIYGSDGFVVMADALDEGDTIAFEADVGSSALEIWAQLTDSDGSISEADGYAAHVLVLPAQAQDTTKLAAAAAAQEAAQPDAGKPAINTTALLAVAAVAALSLGSTLYKSRSVRKKAQADTLGAVAPTEAKAGTHPDNTVEYLTIPEQAPAGKSE